MKNLQNVRLSFIGMLSPLLGALMFGWVATPAIGQSSCETGLQKCQASVKTEENACIQEVEENVNPTVECSEWTGTDYYEECV
ncbi:MAG: hypothetical protein WCF17_21070 [Terracidiphilus sp.]